MSQPPGVPISVFIADDHSIVREGLAALLAAQPDIRIAGAAANGREALGAVLEAKPAVVIMDIAMPEMNGIEAARQIHAALPQTQIVILSMHASAEHVFQALEAGARGYVLKNAVDLELPAAIRKVAEGKTVLDPQVAKRSALKGERNGGLTARELEILQLIVDGKSNKEIADQLGLSVNTVAVHRANIMDALGIHKAAELVVYAIRNGLVNIP